MRQDSKELSRPVQARAGNGGTKREQKKKHEKPKFLDDARELADEGCVIKVSTKRVDRGDLAAGGCVPLQGIRVISLRRCRIACFWSWTAISLRQAEAGKIGVGRSVRRG